MLTFVLNPEKPQQVLIEQVVSVLRDDGVIIYPTDTVYGLGCDIFNKKALEKIYRLKKRSKTKPMSFICADFVEIGQFALVSNQAFRLMRRVLPGAFTFITTASNLAPRTVIDKKKRTVGIRIPDNLFCLALVKALGNPIFTTSVNYSGEKVLFEPQEICEQFGNRVDAFIDSGVLGSEPSTIVDVTGDSVVVVRQGKGVLPSY